MLKKLPGSWWQVELSQVAYAFTEKRNARMLFALEPERHERYATEELAQRACDACAARTGLKLVVSECWSL